MLTLKDDVCCIPHTQIPVRVYLLVDFFPVSIEKHNTKSLLGLRVSTQFKNSEIIYGRFYFSKVTTKRCHV